jgi:DNA-binding winged helix-turn-helix (wHTH) protein
MPGIEQQQPTFQFGVFELDLRTGELCKHGIKLKLQEHPLQVLMLLLEHAGEVVSREEMQKRLWPEEHTYVDFDNAINTAVRKLRDALGDSPETPRFIETLARPGSCHSLAANHAEKASRLDNLQLILMRIQRNSFDPVETSSGSYSCCVLLQGFQS